MMLTGAPAMLAAGSLLWGWLWPFGDKESADSGPTISSIYARSAEVSEDVPVSADVHMVIEQYRLFVDLDAGDPAQRIEAMRRLADLSLEVAEEMLADQGDEAAVAAQLGEAIDVYERLLEFAPDYENRDHVLYQLARAADAAGRHERAESALEALALNEPDSPLNAEAWFRRGEGHFARTEYAKAARAYESVLRRDGEGLFADQARYKLGWANFKRGLHDESAESFLTLLDGLLPQGGEDPAAVLQNASRAEREIFEDVLRALAIGFSYDAGHESVAELAGTRSNTSYLWLLYSRLGELYLEKERYLDAAGSYMAFSEIRPSHDQAPRLHVMATQALVDGGFPEQGLQSRRRYVTSYGFDSSFWAGRERDVLPDVTGRLRSNLGLLAEHDHALAQSGIDNEAAERAMASYRKFVAFFPTDPQSPERHFMLGELLFEAGRYPEAVKAYVSVAYAYDEHPRSAEAGWAAVVAGQKHAEGLIDAAAREWLLATIDERIRFGRSFPLHAESDSALVSAAEDLYAAGSLPAAVEIADEILERALAPADELVALRVSGHARFDLADYSAAESAYGRMLGSAVLAAEERPALNDRIAASIYRQAEAQAAAGERQAAVDSFLRVGDAAPGTETQAVALHDAAALLIGQQSWEPAIPVLRKLRREFPDHALSKDAGVRLALALESSGDSAGAAQEYEMLAEDTSRSDDVRQAALASSIDLYEGAGNMAAAVAAARRHIESWPNPLTQAMDLRQRLADWAQAQQDVAQRRHWLGEIVVADARAGEQRSDRTRYLAAHAALELAEPLVESYSGARLVMPLESSLRMKQARMELALEALGKAAAYGVADVSTAATHATGEIYADLADALLESQRPDDLSELELEEYQFLLEEQAYPFEEKAIEIYQINARRAAEGVYDESVRASYARLRELVPGRYDRSERMEPIVARLDGANHE